MSSLHNSLKDATKISNAIRRMFGGDQDLSVERLSETLQPVVNIWEHPYCAFLRGEVFWNSFRDEAAVAGEYGMGAVANPSGSKMLVVVDALEVYGTATSVHIALVQGWDASAQKTTLAKSASLPRATDTRDPAVARTEIWVGTHTTNTLATNQLDQVISSTADYMPAMCTPLILKPDTAVVLVFNTANVNFRWKARGSERPAVSGELGI